jgi:hypothetical protein
LFSSPEDISAFSAELAEKICRTFEDQINNLNNDSDVRTFARVVFALLQSYIMEDLPKVDCAMNNSQRANCLEDCFISIITRPKNFGSKSATDSAIDILNKFKPIKQLLKFMDLESDTVRWKGQDRNALKLLYYSCFVETSAAINSTADSCKASNSTNSIAPSTQRYFGLDAKHAPKYGFRNSDVCPSGFVDITKDVDNACAPKER